MKELEAYWVGDKIEVINTGQVGIYEGVSKDGKAKIRIANQTVILSSDEFKLSSPENKKNQKLRDILQEENNASSLKQSSHIPNSIDLHIDRLAPHLTNSLPQLILNYQIQKCKDYIRSALDKNYKRFTIIHGKGEGVLKSEVLHLLKDFDGIAYVIPQNDGGAMEVWTK